MDFLHRNVNTLFQHYIGQSPENQHVISISQLVKFAVSSDLCIEWASNRMVVPRAALLITHVKGLEGDMELVPRERERERENERNFLVSSLRAVTVMINTKTWSGATRTTDALCLSVSASPHLIHPQPSNRPSLCLRHSQNHI